MEKEKNKIILLFGFFIFTTIFSYFSFYGLYEKIALSGFSPIHYTHLKIFPENFVSNFRSGVETYDKSIFMMVYPFLGRYLEVQPELTLKGAMVLEYFILFLTSFFLLKVLRPRSGPLEIFALWFIFCSSYGTNTNIAKFGFLLQGQYYNFAHFFGIMGILLCLKSRFFLAVFCLISTLLIHSTLGAMAIFLALCTFLSSPKLFLQKQAFIPFLLLGLGTIVWCGWVVLQNTTGSGAIPHELWVTLTRMENFHWYPYHLGFFTVEPWEIFIPFLCFLLILIHYLPLQKNMVEVDKKIVGVFLGALFLTIVGVFISVFLPYPFLIKLALHRISIFVLFLGWPYLVAGIFQDIKEGSILQKSIALTTLLFPFVNRHSIFMIIPTLFLTRSTIKGIFQRSPVPRAKKWIIYAILGIFLFSMMVKGYGDFSAVKFFFLNALGKRWWQFFFIIFIVFQLLDFFKAKSFTISKKLVNFFPVITLLLGVAIFQRDQLPSDLQLSKGKDYLETQLWAKNHTPRDALFMVDPTIFYGWRDFSQRSSFGNLREWVHFAWLYDSDERFFWEGMRRFSLFKLPIENYITGFFPTIKGHQKLSLDIENAFYSFDDTWFKNIQGDYGIQYIVMQKEKLKKQYSFPIVFENSQFIVFRLPEWQSYTYLTEGL